MKKSGLLFNQVPKSVAIVVASYLLTMSLLLCLIAGGALGLLTPQIVLAQPPPTIELVEVSKSPHDISQPVSLKVRVSADNKPVGMPVMVTASAISELDSSVAYTATLTASADDATVFTGTLFGFRQEGSYRLAVRVAAESAPDYAYQTWPQAFAVYRLPGLGMPVRDLTWIAAVILAALIITTGALLWRSQQRIDEVRARNITLPDTLGEAKRAAHSEAEELRKKLEQAEKEAEAEVAKLRQDLQVSQEQSRKVEEERDRLQQQIKKAKSKPRSVEKASEAEVAKLRQDVQVLQEQSKKVEKERDRLQQQINKSKSKLEKEWPSDAKKIRAAIKRISRDNLSKAIDEGRQVMTDKLAPAFDLAVAKIVDEARSLASQVFQKIFESLNATKERHEQAKDQVFDYIREGLASPTAKPRVFLEGLAEYYLHRIKADPDSLLEIVYEIIQEDLKPQETLKTIEALATGDIAAEVRNVCRVFSRLVTADEEVMRDTGTFRELLREADDCLRTLGDLRKVSVRYVQPLILLYRFFRDCVRTNLAAFGAVIPEVPESLQGLLDKYSEAQAKGIASVDKNTPLPHLGWIVSAIRDHIAGKSLPETTFRQFVSELKTFLDATPHDVDKRRYSPEREVLLGLLVYWQRLVHQESLVVAEDFSSILNEKAKQMGQQVSSQVLGAMKQAIESVVSQWPEKVLTSQSPEVKELAGKAEELLQRELSAGELTAASKIVEAAMREDSARLHDSLYLCLQADLQSYVAEGFEVLPYGSSPTTLRVLIRNIGRDCATDVTVIDAKGIEQGFEDIVKIIPQPPCYLFPDEVMHSDLSVQFKPRLRPSGSNANVTEVEVSIQLSIRWRDSYYGTRDPKVTTLTLKCFDPTDLIGLELPLDQSKVTIPVAAFLQREIPQYKYYLHPLVVKAWEEMAASNLGLAQLIAGQLAIYLRSHAHTYVELSDFENYVSSVLIKDYPGSIRSKFLDLLSPAQQEVLLAVSYGNESTGPVNAYDVAHITGKRPYAWPLFQTLDDLVNQNVLAVTPGEKYELRSPLLRAWCEANSRYLYKKSTEEPTTQ